MSTSCPRDGDPMLNLSSPEATPEQFLMKKELSQTILRAIHSLPATDAGKLHMISTLTTSAMTKSQRNADCRIVPSLGRLHRAKHRIAKKVKRSFYAFGIFWKDWETAILKATENHANPFTFLVYLFCNSSRFC